MPRDAAAIIVAAGQGLRFGGKIRKQYLKLGNRPIMWWSLRAFQKSPSIGSIVLVAPKEDVDRLRPILRRWKMSKVVAIVAGGATRAQSVFNGLAAVPSEYRWIAVHDAVRPLATVELIEKTLAAARKHRAAIAACPSRDTIKLADSHGGHVHSSPPREKVWLAHTPQIFERRLLEKAHARGRHLPVTDDAQLVERLGVRVALVESPPENLKVTLPLDLEVAKLFLRAYKV